MTRSANRLSLETSPYLQQHAHNPVDWYPWGEDAWERARREDRPVLLSIGYSACHWCHVMERESFEDGAIAAQMNAHFVSIKVDREERPDVDALYMAATVAMSGHGGWPMTVFLMPDKRPFFAGTYFPKSARYGRPGFGELLTRIAEVWRDDRAGVAQQAEALTRAVRERVSVTAPGERDPRVAEAACAQLHDDYDAKHGGFGGAPKFPPCPALRLLLREYARGEQPAIAEMLRGTLDGMARGGMRDQLGGGFARYSTDERWHVPHFEKMLYDNAQLARVYVEAHQLLGDALYRDVATDTLDYLLREMIDESGLFFSATDADSEGVEGKFFTFTRAELATVLDADEHTAFCAYYDVREEGNWEDTNVLWSPRAFDDVADALGMAEHDLRARVAAARPKVLALRATRVPPARDEKIILSWNALTISAFAQAGAALAEPRYTAAAARALHALMDLLTRPDGGLFRTARDGRAHLDAYLEDYAFLGSAALDVYEASGAREALLLARALCTRMVDDFYDEADGTFYQTAHSHEALVARARDAHDDAIPNAAAVAVELCARLGHGREDAALVRVAERASAAFNTLIARAPRAFCTMIGAAELAHDGAPSVALVGDAERPDLASLARVVWATYLPHRVVLFGDGADPRDEPLLRERPRLSGAATAYVCVRQTCSPPITQADPLARALLAARRTDPG